MYLACRVFQVQSLLNVWVVMSDESHSFLIKRERHEGLPEGKEDVPPHCPLSHLPGGRIPDGNLWGLGVLSYCFCFLLFVFPSSPIFASFIFVG